MADDSQHTLSNSAVLILSRSCFLSNYRYIQGLYIVIVIMSLRVQIATLPHLPDSTENVEHPVTELVSNGCNSCWIYGNQADGTVDHDMTPAGAPQ